MERNASTPLHPRAVRTIGAVLAVCVSLIGLMVAQEWQALRERQAARLPLCQANLARAEQAARVVASPPSPPSRCVVYVSIDGDEVVLRQERRDGLHLVRIVPQPDRV